MIKGTYDQDKHAELLYEMDLHECLKFSEELYVTRVPGGWIYDRTVLDKNNSNESIAFMQSMFIPYNEEFKKPESLNLPCWIK